MDYNVKAKIDNKFFNFGNVRQKEGDRGPRLGLRLSPELRTMLAGKKDGEWVNFLLFPNDKKPSEAPQSGGYDDGSNIPF